MGKVIFVLLDGLSYEAACRHACYLRSLTDAGIAQFFKLKSQLPPLSRPCYATLLTGLDPLEHHIFHNSSHEILPPANIFAHARQKSLITAAAAYHWILELCTGLQFDLIRHRHWHDEKSSIQHGIFYDNDSYPDNALFADAEYLRKSCSPDLLFVHNMGIDFKGHQYGSSSPQYAQAVAESDQLLAQYIPIWLAAGHAILIASDHGMDAQGCHYSTDHSVMDIPLWFLGNGWPAISGPAQSDIADLVCQKLAT